jgi:serine/threonine-protein kinase
MIEASAHDQAPTRAQDTDRDPRPLAGLASCADLPEHEGIGPPLEQELQPGFVLDGRFRIEAPIGRSGMATVYRASDQHTGRSVAVKIPLMRVESDPAAFGRYQREERICASLSDPLLLRYIPVEPSLRSRAYFVTEYLDGCSLALVMHRTKPIPEGEALRIASVACSALGEMHRRGYMHLDVKPANFMVGRDGSLCLLDFGLAAEVEPKAGLLSAMTPVFGTPDYMAPEHLQNKRCDSRSDLYSLGVILHQMLTGVLPFVGDDPWKAARQRVSGDPVAPRLVNSAISPEAEEIVLRAMRRDPSERYPSADAFKADLDSPRSVRVTGLCDQLRAPHFQMSLTGTPILSGVLIGVGTLAAFLGLFLALMHHHR